MPKYQFIIAIMLNYLLSVGGHWYADASVTLVVIGWRTKEIMGSGLPAFELALY
jgi:hypothetical protein